MKIQEGHLHASSAYGPTTAEHYFRLGMSMVVGKCMSVKSVTAHLPLEIQHPKIYVRLKFGGGLIWWGEILKKLLAINLYWENSPLLNYGTWDLKHGQSSWTNVPQDIDLCLDTGHLILGAKGKGEARRRLENILRRRGKQIKHIHLHENDLVHDRHWLCGRVINKKFEKYITQGRSHIYEK